MTPSARSLKLLREQGYIVTSVERYNSFIKQRFDAFGFGDILACNGKEILLVQTTTKTNVSARIKKIKGISEHKTWLASGGHIQVHGWHKVKNRWKCEVTPIY